MVVIRFAGAWGSYSEMYSHWELQAREYARGSPVVVQVYQKGDSSGRSMGWSKVDPSFCPNELNPWHCYYLPMTNCSPPVPLDECTTATCLETLLVGTVPGSPEHEVQANREHYFLPNALVPSATHSRVSEIEFTRRVKELTTKYPFNKHERLDGTGYKGDSMTTAFNISTPEYSELFGKGIGLWYAMGFNTRMRGLIAQTVQKWMAHLLVPWDTTKPSVAIQIRRGDKVSGLTPEQLDKQCAEYKEGKRVMCGVHPLGAACFDMGCDEPRETRFAVITLDDYLKRARVHLDALGGGNDVFIMTDDGPWVEESAANSMLAKEFNIRLISADPLEQDAFNLDEHVNMKLSETLSFWASVQLCQTCNAFVGHFASSVSQLVYRWMCNQHANTTGVCPAGTTLSANNGGFS